MNNKPWKVYPEIWKTKASFMSYIRGGIRRGLWERSPVKLQFIKDNRIRVPLGRQTEKNPEGLVWGCKCVICEEQFKQAECQVDHKVGNNSLKSIDDLMGFIKSMLFVTHEDLQLVCKPCHKIKTHAERKGITFEQAHVEKEAIKFQKLSKGIQIGFLMEHGFKENEISNSTKRRNCFVKMNTNKDGCVLRPKESV